MKGLILCGGNGTRLRPITNNLQKQLLPIANKPIVFYIIEDMIKSGIHDIGIVVGPNKDQVIKAIQSREWGINIKFINQEAPLGLANAVLSARDFLDEEFVMYLGDNILVGGISEYIRNFKDKQADACILITDVNNPEECGMAVVNRNGIVEEVREKPGRVDPKLENKKNTFGIIGIYFFKPVIVNACNNIYKSSRGEYEITHAIQYLVEKNFNVISEKIKFWWKDIGAPKDLLDANIYICWIK